MQKESRRNLLPPGFTNLSTPGTPSYTQTAIASLPAPPINDGTLPSPDTVLQPITPPHHPHSNQFFFVPQPKIDIDALYNAIWQSLESNATTTMTMTSHKTAASHQTNQMTMPKPTNTLLNPPHWKPTHWYCLCTMTQRSYQQMNVPYSTIPPGTTPLLQWLQSTSHSYQPPSWTTTPCTKTNGHSSCISPQNKNPQCTPAHHQHLEVHFSCRGLDCFIFAQYKSFDVFFVFCPYNLLYNIFFLWKCLFLVTVHIQLEYSGSLLCSKKEIFLI